MNEKTEILKATEEQIQRSRKRILKEHGRPMSGVLVFKSFSCIGQYGQGNPCCCGKAIPLLIPFPEKHKRFMEKIFKLVGE